MKIARLIVCGFAALTFVGSAYALQDAQPSDESATQVATADQGTEVASAASSKHEANKIDLNTADAKALAHAVKGLGMKRAQAIVAYRKEHGNFKSVDDLSQVKGMQKFVKKNHERLENSLEIS